MPNSPHSSWNLSSRHVALKAAPPRVFDAIHGNVHHHSPRCVHDQPLAAGRPDPPPRDRRLRHQRLELALARGLDRDHHPRGPFAEQRLVEPAPRLHRHLAADADAAVGPRAGHRPLRQRHRQPALGAIVSGRHEPGSHGGANRRLHPALHFQIQRRQPPPAPPARPPAPPPSAHSWAPVTSPAPTAARTAACPRRSTSRSSGASRPASRSCSVHRYSEPPRLTPSGPSSAMRCPAALNHCVPSRLASSSTPTTPMIGVGRIAVPPEESQGDVAPLA